MRETISFLTIIYYNFADELTLQDGVNSKGDRILISKGLRHEMKEQIHISNGDEKRV